MHLWDGLGKTEEEKLIEQYDKLVKEAQIESLGKRCETSRSRRSMAKGRSLAQ